MSQENVDVVRRAYEALNERDADAFLEATDPDVVQDWSRSISMDPGVFRGHEQVKRFLRSWWDAFDESVIEVDDLIDAGDRVVAVFHARNRGRASGAEVEGRGAALVWAFRDGKVISATLYQDRADALEAAGSGD